MEFAPGTVVDVMINDAPTEEARQELIARYNLDKPMIYRYGLYMFRLIQGDLGVSDQTQVSVWNTFISRLPNTLILAFSALIIGAVVSIPLGIAAARKARTIIDNSVTVIALIGMSMPVFWLGLLLILLFSLRLGWLPSGTFDHGIRSLILPAFCSSLQMIANSARQTRSNMLEVLKADYLRTARAKGVPEETVIRKHALGNALIPIITAIGTSLSFQLAGSVVVESVFTWPGIGRMAAEAVKARDVTTTTGVVIMTTILFVLLQLAVDLLYAYFDPRIKAQYVNRSRKKKKSSGSVKAPGAPAAAITVVERERESGQLPRKAFETASEHLQSAVTGAEAAMQVAAPEAVTDNAKKFVTRDIEKTAFRLAGAADSQSRLTDDRGESKSGVAKYKKRSQIGEIFHSLRKNKGAMVGLVIFGLLLVTFICSLFISWESINAINAKARFSPPSLQHPFGADNFGRDMFMRVVYGSRYTLAIGFGVVAFGMIFGITAGSFAGYYGGKTEDIIMRCSDVIASIPSMLMGMVVVTVLGQNLQNLIIAVGITTTPVFCRMTRASIITVKNNEFVEAARAIGLSNIRIIFNQVLPNGLAPIIVTMTAQLGISVIVAASLSYLGFGVPVVQPEWGVLISGAKDFSRNAPYLMTFPGLFIMITVLAFNLLGDGLRDALDPKLKR